MLHNLLQVETGLDILLADQFDILLNKRVGVITNHTALTKDQRHIVDLFLQTKDVNLTAIFSPEHGVRGLVPDGFAVSSSESEKGLPIYSLFGDTRQPTKEMLCAVDLLVFDIQDVGARFYTYIYTMALAMEAAVAHNKQFVVLDRPNPINGLKTEGPVLRHGFESFLGLYVIPIRHGMTAGELALLFKGENWIASARDLDLEIVKMRGWQRDAWYDETELLWTAPSPSLRFLSTAVVYPGTCLLEGTNISEGRGTERPFEFLGAPWVETRLLASELNGLKLPGVHFKPIEFTPTPQLPSIPNPKHKNKLCGGIFLNVTDRNIFEPVLAGVCIIWIIKQLYPREFAWRSRIDFLFGSDRLRNAVDNGISLEDLMSACHEGVTRFKQTRSPYLLYH